MAALAPPDLKRKEGTGITPEDENVRTSFHQHAFTRSHSAVHQFSDMVDVVHKASRIPYVYQSSLEERELSGFDKSRIDTPRAKDLLGTAPEWPLLKQGPFGRLVLALDVFLGFLCLGVDGIADECGLVEPYTELIMVPPDPIVLTEIVSPEDGPPEPGSCLVHHWNEDLARGPEHCTPITNQHCIIMDNVDYYDGVPEKVAVGVPVLMRTLDITRPAGKDKHRRWRFKGNNMHYTVSYHDDSLGNERPEKKFIHPLWDWRNGSTVSIGVWSFHVSVRKDSRSDFKFVLLTPITRRPEAICELALRLFGINPHYTISASNKALPAIVLKSWAVRLYGWCATPIVDLSETPILVGGPLPEGYWSRLGDSILASFNFGFKRIIPPADPLQRIQVAVQGERNAYSVMYNCRPGSKPVARLSYEEKMDLKDKKESIPQDDTSLAYIAINDDFESRELDYSYLIQMLSRRKMSPANCMLEFDEHDPRDRRFVMEFAEDVCKVWVAESHAFIVLYDNGNMQRCEPDKFKAPNALMQPLVVEPVVPVNSKSNDIQGTNKRLIEVMAQRDTTIAPEDHTLIEEFVTYTVEHFFKYSGKSSLVKVSLEYVLEKQESEKKRQTIEESILASLREEIGWNKTFTKKENDGGERDGIKAEPRVITMKERDRVKAHYLAYIYALKEFIKAMPFIMVGCQVSEIEDKIRSICGYASGDVLFEGDLSRMDGRKSLIARVLFDRLLQALFRGRERGEARMLHMLTIGMKLKSANGVKSTNGFAQASGMPDTTENNSYENAYMMYKAKRIDGSDPDDAWDWLKKSIAVSGDDSLGCNLSKLAYERSVIGNGHKPKFFRRGRLEPFGFLGRLYGPGPGICSQVVTSVQDPARIMIKFTITPTHLTTQDERRKRLFDKACAIITSDPFSPHISIVAQSILRAGKTTYDWDYVENFDLNYNIDHGKYNNSGDDWTFVAFASAWPSADFDSMDQYFSRDLTFDQIEIHPNFCQVKRIDKPGLSLMTKSLDHNEKAQIKQFANIPSPMLSDGPGTDPAEGAAFRKAVGSAIKQHSAIVSSDNAQVSSSSKRVVVTGDGPNRTSPRQKPVRVKEKTPALCAGRASPIEDIDTSTGLVTSRIVEISSEQATLPLPPPSAVTTPPGPTVEPISDGTSIQGRQAKDSRMSKDKMQSSSPQFSAHALAAQRRSQLRAGLVDLAASTKDGRVPGPMAMAILTADMKEKLGMQA
jgi:hypothetical protein